MREVELAGLTVRVMGGTDGEGGGNGGLIVLLHGFGAPGTDLVPLGRQLRVPAGTRWAFPAAPHELGDLGGIPSYMEARAWWMIDMEKLEAAMRAGSTRDRSQEEPEGMAEATAQVGRMLESLEEQLGASPEHTVIGGFSQGSMLATNLLLSTDRPFAGLLVLSGTLLAEERWRAAMAARKGTKVLQTHGRQDPLLSFQNAEQLRDAFVAGGLDMTWREFNGGHSLPDSLFREVPAFLEHCLEGADA